MKIYTKKGDTGETSLFGAGRVSKTSLRIQAYGTVDELNSCIGLARAHNLSDDGEAICQKLQNELFILGSDLATPNTGKATVTRIQTKNIKSLEDSIDRLEESLDPLTYFILPGGGKAGSLLHLARTICRRAERLAIACKESGEEISDEVIKYMNRLSDLLFVLARYENKLANKPEEQWKIK
ncbi:MAG TPA: cob(I)yrinic acid a,c-diamide adenosyltransferase [Balneolales bacterium]|nr:cob(I)yrinic acid a,c-diamide adenosyltransferase [Balneolales bacterium]